MAHQSGVRPDLFELSGLASFRPNTGFTIPTRPFSAAHASGVGHTRCLGRQGWHLPALAVLEKLLGMLVSFVSSKHGG